MDLNWYDVEDKIYEEFSKLKTIYEDDFKVFLPEDIEDLMPTEGTYNWNNGKWLRGVQDISILCERTCENDPALIARVIFNLIYQGLILTKMVRILGAKYKAILDEKYPEYKNIIEIKIHGNILKYVTVGKPNLELGFDRAISGQPWYREYCKLDLHCSNMWTVAETLQHSKKELVVDEIPVSFEILGWTNERTNSMHNISITKLGSVLKTKFLDRIKEIIAEQS